MRLFAAAEGSIVFGNTTHDHPRGAMVNYLLTETGVKVPDSFDETQIRFLFTQVAARANEMRGRLPPRIVELDAMIVREIDLDDEPYAED